MNKLYIDVSIRDFVDTDIEKKVNWINDHDNNQFLHYPLPLTVEKTREWYKQKDNRYRLDCTIEYKYKPVGIIGLIKIDPKLLEAEYYITLGEKWAKGKGIGYKASKALLDYAFFDLGLMNVYLTVEPQNEAAIRLYKKLGFKQVVSTYEVLCQPSSTEELQVDKDGLNKDLIQCQNDLGNLDEIFELACFENDKSVSLNCIKKLAQESSDGVLKFVLSKHDYLSRRYLNTPIYKQDVSVLDAFDSSNTFYIKREDFIPFSFGGNKARKALLFFEEIDAGKYSTVVTYGSTSSNHCRLIANLCKARNIICHIISPEEGNEATMNKKIIDQLDAVWHFAPVSQISETIDQIMISLVERGEKPFFIPGGGHGNIGTQAYVDCFDEIREYEKKNQIQFDYIFFASGTGTTQAGLVAGKLVRNSDTNIIGISIARKNPRGRDIVVESIQDYLIMGSENLKRKDQIENKIQESVWFIDEFISDGYHSFSADDQKAVLEIFNRIGLPLDSTYTGKAFTGMMKFLKEHKVVNSRILFIHTGGTPLFFDQF